MARKVPWISAGQRRRFVPESFGNRSDPMPVVINYRTPTEREKRELTSAGGKMRITKDGEVESSSADDLVRQHAIVSTLVESIENYSDASGPIETGKDLVARGESPFVFEAALEIVSTFSLTEEQAKKSDGSQG